MTVSVFSNLPMEQYLAIDAVSSSRLKRLKLLDHSARRYQQNPSRSSRALSMGTLVHTATLEPDHLRERHPAYDGRKDKRTAAYQEFLATHPGTEPCSTADRAQAALVGMAVREAAPEFFDGRELVELSVVWDEDGVQCKARFDVLHPEHGEADLKTTRDCSARSFPWDCKRYGYFIQRAWYRRALEAAVSADLLVAPLRSTIIAAEVDPVSVGVYEVCEEAIAAHQVTLDGYMETIRRCQHDRHFPDVGRQLLTYPGSLPGGEDIEDGIDWSEV
jgi:hypothetical protein